jgi:hypothetical protein
MSDTMRRLFYCGILTVGSYIFQASSATFGIQIQMTILEIMVTSGRTRHDSPFIFPVGNSDCWNNGYTLPAGNVSERILSIS